MPGYKVHIAAGVVSCFILIYLISLISYFSPTYLQLIGCFVCAILGSIFPDIDTTSKAQRLFFMFSTMILLACILFQVWYVFLNFSFITVVVTFLKHRTITHNIYFLFILSFLLLVLGAIVFHGLSAAAILSVLGFAVGALSHLLLDFGL